MGVLLFNPDDLDKNERATAVNDNRFSTKISGCLAFSEDEKEEVLLTYPSLDEYYLESFPKGYRISGWLEQDVKECYYNYIANSLSEKEYDKFSDLLSRGASKDYDGEIDDLCDEIENGFIDVDWGKFVKLDVGKVFLRQTKLYLKKMKKMT